MEHLDQKFSATPLHAGVTIAAIGDRTRGLVHVAIATRRVRTVVHRDASVPQARQLGSLRTKVTTLGTPGVVGAQSLRDAALVALLPVVSMSSAAARAA